MGKEIILAENAGFCFGVKRAVDQAIATGENCNTRVYTLGPLIHNNDVVNYLRNKGIDTIEMEDVNKLHETDVVIIRSHGVGPSIIEAIKIKGATVIDATCPYVSHIHKKVKSFYDQGYKIIVVGDKSHPEVIGINGWCNNEAIITKDGSEIEKLPPKVCVVSQTTEKQEIWQKVLFKLSVLTKELVAFNTICSATEARQKSAEDISKAVDVMFVIGSKTSSNTNKLFEICKKNCANTFFIENSTEIPQWVIEDINLKKIGITAGASTPDWIIKEALLKMNEENVKDFNEQLAYMDQYDKQIAVGEIVKGEVISVNDKEAFLNIGYKADAILPVSEATFEPNASLKDIIKVGEVIEAKVISRRNEDGYVVLSKVELERQSSYNYIKTAFEEKTPVTVNVKEAVKGGLVATYKGVRIFIPASHIELFHVDNLNEFAGKTLQINVVEFNEAKRYARIIGSRRDLLKAQKDKLEEEAFSKLDVDMIVEGEVKRLTNFGAFVDIMGVDGLLHVSEISWGRVSKPSDALKVGDVVKVKVLEINKETKKITLSMKALQPNPWSNVEVKYPVDSVVLGKVVRFADFGAFVELEPGVDALVHISEISHKRINKPSEALELGQQIKAKIIDVNLENKKIGLSIKAVE